MARDGGPMDANVSCCLLWDVVHPVVLDTGDGTVPCPNTVPVQLYSPQSVAALGWGSCPLPPGCGAVAGLLDVPRGSPLLPPGDCGCRGLITSPETRVSRIWTSCMATCQSRGWCDITATCENRGWSGVTATPGSRDWCISPGTSCTATFESRVCCGDISVTCES
jgi:hypothetical protein